jgi:hypothetical protein
MAHNLHLHVLTFQGYHYAGLQYAVECYCDNTYNSYGTVDKCTMHCSGDHNQICGGSYALSVYRTRECYQYRNMHTHDVLVEWLILPPVHQRPNAATQCDRISNAPDTPSLRPTKDRLAPEKDYFTHKDNV